MQKTSDRYFSLAPNQLSTWVIPDPFFEIDHACFKSADHIEVLLKEGSTEKAAKTLAESWETNENFLDAFGARKPYCGPRHQKIALDTFFGLNGPEWLQTVLRLKLPPRYQLLDVGAGNSPHSRALSKMDPRLSCAVVLEPEPSMRSAYLEQTQSSIQIHFVDSTWEQFNQINTKQFDLVICNYVLSYLKKPILALKNLGTLLKPGGYLLMQDFVVPQDLCYFDSWVCRELTMNLRRLSGRPIPNGAFERLAKLLDLQLIERIGPRQIPFDETKERGRRQKLALNLIKSKYPQIDSTIESPFYFSLVCFQRKG